MHALLDCIAQLTPPTDAGRLFHGRGGRYPGCEHLSLDAYPPVLLLTSFTGLALLAGRDTSWMGILLAIHLGVVMALFLTLPYGKFAHGFYRCAALLKWAIEKRRGKQVGVAGD